MMNTKVDWSERDCMNTDSEATVGEQAATVTTEARKERNQRFLAGLFVTLSTSLDIKHTIKVFLSKNWLSLYILEVLILAFMWNPLMHNCIGRAEPMTAMIFCVLH